MDTASGVSLNKTVDAIFNEAMNPTTINSSTFTITKGTTPIAGVITYSGTTATFTPTNNFLPNTKYTGTITAGVKDPAGNAMISNYVWNFTTGAGPDITPPTVISTDPANAAIGVALNKKISATFSEPMDSLSATTSFTLVNTTLGGTQLMARFLIQALPLFLLRQLILLRIPLTQVRLLPVQKTLPAMPLLGKYVWNFTTSSDATPPTVISTDPLNTATNVALDKKIAATFSEAMNPLTLNATTFILKQGANAVLGTVTYSGTTATFSPSADLAPSTIYTATITTGAKDLAGNATGK